MEPKVIGVISNNLEIVRKICENKEETFKKTFSEIMNGEDVKGIVNVFLDKMEEQRQEIVNLQKSIGGVGVILKNNKKLMNDDNKKQIVEILKTISDNVASIVKKTYTDPKTKENQEMIKNILGDIKKDEHTKILLAASLIGKDVVKNLSKIPLFTKFAKKGVSGLDEVLFGSKDDGGLIGIIKKIKKSEKTLKNANKSIDLISGSTKQLVKIAIMMTAMVVLAIPAIMGALLTSAFVWIFLKTNKLLLENHKQISKGLVVMDQLMLGLVFMGLAMVLMYKSVQDVEWNEFGMIAATVGVLSGVVILLNKFSKPIKHGIELMTAMGIGFIMIGLSMMIMYKSVQDADWEQFGKVAATVLVLGGVVIFLGLMKQNIASGAAALLVMGIGYTLLGISMMILYKSVEDVSWEKFGMMLVTIGGLATLTALIGIPVVAACVALGSLALGLMGTGLISLSIGISMFNLLVSDDALDKVAMGIPKVIDALTSVFKSSDKKNPTFGDGVLGLVLGALRLGGAIFAAGSLIFIGISLGIFALCVKPWNTFNKKSIDNIEYAVRRLYDIFELDNDNEGVSFSNVGNGILGLMLAALKFGKTFFQMGTILLVSFAMGSVYNNVMKWKNYDKNSMKNFEDAYNKIKEIFQLDKTGPTIGDIGDGLIGLMTSALQFGKTFFQIGTILLSVYTMNLVYSNLQKWSNFDTKTIENFENVYNKIRTIFKLDENGKSLSGLSDGLFGFANSVLKFGQTLFEMGTIILCMYSMNLIYSNIQKWSNFDTKTIENFENVYNKIRTIFKLDDENKKGIGGLINNVFGLASSLLNFGQTFFEMGTILLSVITMGHVYDNIQKWKSYDPNSMKNFESVYNKLRTMFKLDDDKKEGVVGKLFNNIFGLASSMLSLGKTYFEMGTILMAVITMGQVYDNIQKWKTYDPNSLKNFEDVYSKLRTIFKLDDTKQKGENGIFGSFEKMASTMIAKGTMFHEMGMVLMAVITMSHVYDNLKKWEKFNPVSITNFEYAYGQMRKIFKFDDTKQKGFNGLLGNIGKMANTMLEKGTMFHEMGMVLMAVITMGHVYDNLKKWEKFNPMSITNFEYAYGQMRRIFKFDKPRKGEGFSAKIGNSFTESILAMADKNKLFGEMATLMVASTTMSNVYDMLKKWESFDKGSISNFEFAYDAMRRIFKFDEPRNGGNGFLTTFCNKFEDSLYAQADKNKTFNEMATILVAVKTMNFIYNYLKVWESFNQSSLTNFESAYSKIRDIFKFDKPREDDGFFGNFGNIFETAIYTKAGKNKTFNEMATILIAVKTMNLVYNYLKVWNDFKQTSLTNFESAYSKIRDIFKFDKPREDDGFFGNLSNSIEDIIVAKARKNKTYSEMATIVMSVKTMSWIYTALKKWETFDTKSLDNFETAVGRLQTIVLSNSMNYYNLDEVRENMKIFKDIIDTYTSITATISAYQEHILKFNNLSNVIKNTLTGWDMEEFRYKTGSITKSLNDIFTIVEKPGSDYNRNVYSTIRLFGSLRTLQNLNYNKTTRPLRSIIDKVNKLDIEKAVALTDMFKSFANMREKNIFSSFQDSVEEFTEACIRLVDAINGNTDALNSSDDTSTYTSSGNPTTSSNGSTERKGTAVKLINIEELAQAIAQRISYSGRSQNSINTVDLRINGQGGDFWTIRRGF